MKNKISLDQFRKQFEDFKKKGLIQSKRGGPTSTGHLLEMLLGIEENKYEDKLPLLFTNVVDL